MDDIFSKISSMLENPETAGKLKDIAASVMGDSSPSGGQADLHGAEENGISETVSVAERTPGLPDLFASFPKLRSDDRSVTLLKAIKPYMRETRAGKIDSAIRIMQMLKVFGNLK